MCKFVITKSGVFVIYSSDFVFLGLFSGL
jgi:hypothetical protein